MFGREENSAESHLGIASGMSLELRCSNRLIVLIFQGFTGRKRGESDNGGRQGVELYRYNIDITVLFLLKKILTHIIPHTFIMCAHFSWE